MSDWKERFPKAFKSLLGRAERGGLRDAPLETVIRVALGTVHRDDQQETELAATAETMRRIGLEGWHILKDHRDLPLFEALWEPLPVPGRFDARLRGMTRRDARRVEARYLALTPDQRLVVTEMLEEGAREKVLGDEAAEPWRTRTGHSAESDLR